MFQDVNGDAEHISGANFTFGNNLKALFSSSKCVDSVSIPMSIPTDMIEGSICCWLPGTWQRCAVAKQALNTWSGKQNAFSKHQDTPNHNVVMSKMVSLTK